MQVKYSIPVDVDQPIHEAARERPDESIRLRIHPQVWRAREKGEQYIAWPKVSWTLECPTVADATSIREGLNLYFRLASHLGPSQLLERLEQIQADE